MVYVIDPNCAVVDQSYFLQSQLAYDCARRQPDNDPAADGIVWKNNELRENAPDAQKFSDQSAKQQMDDGHLTAWFVIFPRAGQSGGIKSFGIEPHGNWRLQVDSQDLYCWNYRPINFETPADLL